MTPAFPDARNTIEPDCARCPALVDCRERISWGTGPTDADVLVVGEAPGSGDPDADRWRGGNWTGKAYTTRHSGRRVRSLLAEVGHSDAYFTNAVKCYPSDGEGGTRPPTDEELAACRAHLETELETVDPAVVVPTGKHATRTLLAFDDRDLDGFLDTVLDPIRLASIDALVLPILHPSYQNVWFDRLGYERAEYVEEFRRQLIALSDG